MSHVVFYRERSVSYIEQKKVKIGFSFTCFFFGMIHYLCRGNIRKAFELVLLECLIGILAVWMVSAVPEMHGMAFWISMVASILLRIIYADTANHDHCVLLVKRGWVLDRDTTLASGGNHSTYSSVKNYLLKSGMLVK